MTADLEKLAGEIEGLLAKLEKAKASAPEPYDHIDGGERRRAFEGYVFGLMEEAVNKLPAIAAALREVSALRDALNAVMAEEMIYTGAITETLEASEMYPALVAKIRAALATGAKP